MRALQRARETAGISIEEMASSLCVSTEVAQKIESFSLSADEPVRLDLFVRYCDRLGIGYSKSLRLFYKASGLVEEPGL